MSKAVMKRRSLLKQLGAAAFLGTPVFRFVFAEAQGQAPLRLVVFHFPSGVSMVNGAEETIRGSTWSFDHYLAPLKDIQSDVLLFEKFPMPTAQLVSTYQELEGHGGGLRTMLTGNTNQRSEEVPGPGGVYGDATSIDQMLANAYGDRTKFGSLQLGVITRTNITAWARRVIYNNGNFIEPVEDARATFARLFPDGGAPNAPAPTMTEDPALTAELIAEHAAGKSRLDLLKAQVNAIKAIAGSDEQAKLDLHLTALRELEQQLPNVGGGPGGPVFQGVTCGAPNIGNPAEPKVDAPEGTNVDYMQELGAVMQELMYQAINCDLTRIASFQWMSSGDNNVYPFLGVNTTHHSLEHGWGESANAKADYDKIQTWLMLNISNFILRLKATPEGNGSMLDNTAVFVASEMWGGHSHHEYIALVAGKAGGKIRGGRMLDGNGRSHNDILAGLVNVFGLNVPVVGDPKYCSGPVELG